jgi:heme-degrading monooxygenase HmoA
VREEPAALRRKTAALKRRIIMYLRLVQLKMKQEDDVLLPKLYADRILPSLQRVPGCLYACLIRSTSNREESMSLTLWESSQQADAYEMSGEFQRLMNDAHPYLDDASEWKVQLTKDYTLEYAPHHEEPVVRSFNVTTAATGAPPSPSDASRLYIRILAISLQSGRNEEFARLYNAEILPVLQETKGCRYAFLTEGLEERNEVLSITIWESKQSADLYESSGIFAVLTEKVQHTFTELYQWKMAAERSAGVTVATSVDLRVRGYDLVTGTSFRK